MQQVLIHQKEVVPVTVFSVTITRRIKGLVTSVGHCSFLDYDYKTENEAFILSFSDVKLWVFSPPCVCGDNKRPVTVHGIHGYNCQILCVELLFAEIIFLNDERDKGQIKGHLLLILAKLNKYGTKDVILLCKSMFSKEGLAIFVSAIWQRVSRTKATFFKEESCLRHLKRIFRDLLCEAGLITTFLWVPLSGQHLPTCVKCDCKSWLVFLVLELLYLKAAINLGNSEHIAV